MPEAADRSAAEAVTPSEEENALPVTPIDEENALAEPAEKRNHYDPVRDQT